MRTNFLSVVMTALALFILRGGSNDVLLAQAVTFTPASSSPYNYNATLTVTEPDEGEIVTVIRPSSSNQAFIEFDASVTAFTLGEKSSGIFPCEPPDLCDSCRWRGSSQYIYVVVDDGQASLIQDVNSTIYLPLPDTAPGPHTIRAYLARSWDESLKDTGGVSGARETNLYSVRTFYIDTNTGTHAFDSTLPLLTLNSPLDTGNAQYPVDSVLLDFYTMFKGFDDGYKVEAVIYDSTMTVLGRDTLTQWVPYCIGGLEEPPANRLRKYFVKVTLLNSSGVPVSNGTPNLNTRQWPFWVRRS